MGIYSKALSCFISNIFVIVENYHEHRFHHSNIVNFFIFYYQGFFQCLNAYFHFDHSILSTVSHFESLNAGATWFYASALNRFFLPVIYTYVKVETREEKISFKLISYITSITWNLQVNTNDFYVS